MLKDLVRKFREKFIRLKVMVNRTKSYVALAQTVMLIFLVLDALDIKEYTVPAVIIGSLLIIIFGYIEIKYFGGFQEEKNYKASINPYFMRIERKLDELLEEKERNKQPYGGKE